MLICMPYHVCTLKDKEEVKYLKSFLLGVLQNSVGVFLVCIYMQILIFFITYLLRWRTNLTLLIKEVSFNCEN